ncbi:YeiH family protein [Sphingobacterium paucimobilis]|uniref:Sulfate exporter family transporter n=1 Tax=Sphingobacterium paucimobilis HER1398 TaxID=1346330 RepID=U2HQD3_9SPHI|nr:putative sulfate exporter family transporter [Sphingobacterium paucimobilis]ERJ57677.1 hypothetical protein M472_02740 [Sphingobacterium paucimobilis HER1398]
MNNSHFLKKGILNKNLSIRELIFIGLGLLCISPFVSPPIALLIGIITAQWLGNPFSNITGKLTHSLLQVSVVGLGFGMDVESAIHASKNGFLLTVVSLLGILFLGHFIGKMLHIDKKIAFLITVGTAICGGSAIAAISPVIKAKEAQISVALATIFILNSIALFVFPVVGHFFSLSQGQFGLWSAVAIQDTSSVVGAASKYGEEALQIATSVKLTRALWIIPVTFFSALVFKNKGSRVQIPYFIGLFILAIIGNTYVAPLHKIAPYIVYLSKSGLTAVLFLIGAGLSAKVLKSVGTKPFVLGLVLWGLIAIPSLLFILYYF